LLEYLEVVKTLTANTLVVTSYEVSPYISPNLSLDTATLYSALTRGPLLVGLNFYQGLSTYTGGILRPPSSTGPCSYYYFTIVLGYGILSTGVEYWIVRGYGDSGWGTNGNFYLARNDSALNCGISCEYSRVNS
jgi:hypothetical protein